MPSDASRPPPIHLEAAGPSTFRVARPGARFAVDHTGEEHRGAWVPAAQPLPAATWTDTFGEEVARAILPLLRDIDRRAAGKGGRPPVARSSASSKLIDRAVAELGLASQNELALAIGVDPATLSRAKRHGLPAAHVEAIETLLAQGATAKAGPQKPPRQ